MRDEHGLRLATVRGVPVYLGTGWALIGVVLIVIFGPQIQRALPDLGLAAYGVAALYALILLVSVLAHEAAHAVAASAVGYPVQRVVANLWGGHTSYEAPTPTPGRSALVAVVGPLTNGLLALLGWWALDNVPRGVPALLTWAGLFANAFVCAFNLLPGLPLDGGFLVEALVWKVTGRRAKGMIVAGWTGRIVTVGVVYWFLVRPLLSGQTPDLVALVWTLFLGAMLWQGASAAIRSGQVLDSVGDIDVAELTHPVVVLPGWMTVREAVEHIQSVGAPTHSGRTWAVLVADEGGTPLGLVDLNAIGGLTADEASTAPLSGFVAREPEGWVYDVRSPEPPAAAELVAHMNTVGAGLLALRRPDGRIDEVISAADIASRLPGGAA